MKKENQRIKLTKRLFRDALLTLLKKKPLQKINISELCQTAGLNRATFYRHYALPQDILNEMQAEIIAETRELSSIPKNPRELRMIIVKICNLLERRAEVIKVIIEYDFEFELIKIFKEHIYEILRAAKLRNNNSAMDEESIQLIASYCAGGGYQLLKEWFSEDIPKSSDEIAEIIISLINNNITITA